MRSEDTGRRTWPFRITDPLLDVVQALVDAGAPDHGWHIAETTGQSGPNVYRALQRLQDAAWVDYTWEDSPEPGKPRRRMYWLTGEGLRRAGELLQDRRPTGANTQGGDGHTAQSGTRR